MYWPDYSLRKRGKRSWLALTLLLALVIGLILGGNLNGWWNLRPTPKETRAETAVDGTPEPVVVIETVVPPTPAMTLPSLAVSTAAPDFALPDLFDDTLVLSLSDYGGRPVILNFWASWCVPCRTEMPALQQVYEEYRDEGLLVLGVNQTYVDDLETARDFVTELALTFPSVRDDSGTTSDELYRVMGLPTTVFITPAGEVAYTRIGQMTDEQIETFGRQLVTGKTVTP